MTSRYTFFLRLGLFASRIRCQFVFLWAVIVFDASFMTTLFVSLEKDLVVLCSLQCYTSEIWFQPVMALSKHSNMQACNAYWACCNQQNKNNNVQYNQQTAYRYWWRRVQRNLTVEKIGYCWVQSVWSGYCCLFWIVFWFFVTTLHRDSIKISHQIF